MTTTELTQRIVDQFGFAPTEGQIQVLQQFVAFLACRQPMSAMLTVARGRSVITETIYEQRYRHLEEMRRMGAKVQVEDRVAFIDGVDKLYGRTVEASDLRAGAALIVAGLIAEGTTTIGGVKYIDRGYERIEDKLIGIGADVRREL